MKEEDFHDIKWRIDQLPVDTSIHDLFEKFPELQERLDGENLTGIKVIDSLTNTQIVMYVIFCYHKFSPFIRKVTDTKQRKHQALVQVGFSFKDGIPEDVASIIANENEKVANIILKFLMGENSMKFSALMMQMDAYYKYNYQLAYTDVKSIKSHMQAIKDIEESIESLSHEVFSGDAELNNFVAGAKLVLTPEQNAHSK